MTTLRLIEVNSLVLAVREQEVLTVAEWNKPTPLPFAPSSVLGIVSVHGRMFTVVDVGILLNRSGAQIKDPRFILALRGDEQLAIATGQTHQVLDAEVQTETTQANSNLLGGTIRVDGETVPVLEVENLFAGVIQGRERRQRRL